MKACTLCLQTNINMCLLGNSAAIDFIQEIFVNNGFQRLTKHHYICFLCKYLLSKSYDFIQKSLRAQKALKELIEDGTKVTVATLLQIDRHKLDLDVNLVRQEPKVIYDIWESNNNYESAKKPLENSNIIDNECIIKNEPSEVDTEVYFIDFYKTECDNDFDDGFTANPIDNVEVKRENDVEIKDDDVNVPYFTEAVIVNTRRARNQVDYKELPDVKVKSKIRKAKSIKSEPKDEHFKEKALKPAPGKRKRCKPKPKVKKAKKLNVDTRIYPMKCDHCKYVIQNKTEHFHHYLFYHEGIPYPYGKKGSYVCQHCGLVKKSSHALNQHELTHGEKKVKCKQCGKLFHNETRLKRHERRHGAVLMTCDYCNKGFVAREDLILHIRTHTGVKPFKCVLCGAAFAHRGNVTIHMRSRHQQDMTGGTLPPPRRRKKPANTNAVYATPQTNAIVDLPSN